MLGKNLGTIMDTNITKLEQLEKDAIDSVLKAEQTMYAYARECEVGAKRVKAFTMYETIRTLGNIF